MITRPCKKSESCKEGQNVIFIYWGRRWKFSITSLTSEPTTLQFLSVATVANDQEKLYSIKSTWFLQRQSLWSKTLVTFHSFTVISRQINVAILQNQAFAQCNCTARASISAKVVSELWKKGLFVTCILGGPDELRRPEVGPNYSIKDKATQKVCTLLELIHCYLI